MTNSQHSEGQSTVFKFCSLYWIVVKMLFRVHQ